MTQYWLTSPIEAALSARQAAQLADQGTEPEEWILPAGQHSLSQGLSLGVPGKPLSLTGQADTQLRLDHGILLVQGSTVSMRNLQITALDGNGALRVEGDFIRLDRIFAEGGKAGQVTEAMSVQARHSAKLNHCQAAMWQGSRGSALVVRARLAQLTGARAEGQGESVMGIHCEADEKAVLSDCSVTAIQAQGRARGIVVTAPLLEVTGLTAMDMQGGTACDGIELYSPGNQGLLALGVRVANLNGDQGLCSGMTVACGGSLQLSGFEAKSLTGRQIQGVVVLGSQSVDLESGRLEKLRGSEQGAVGLRVLSADPKSDLRISDLTVEELGSVNPTLEPHTAEGIADWAATLAGRLAEVPFDDQAIPALPSAAHQDVVGVQIIAAVDTVAWVRGGSLGSVDMDGLLLRRIAGTALQLDAGLRPALLRRTEIWACVRPGWLEAEQLRIAGVTIHHHRQPLLLGAGEIEVYNALFSGIPGGAAPVLEEEAHLAHIAAAFATDSSSPWRPLESLPYRNPGPDVLPANIVNGEPPPPSDVDLSLAADAAIAQQAVSIDAQAPFLGAHEPYIPSPCHLKDPQRPAWRPAPPALDANPPVDYRARDAQTLLEVMLERARVTMPSWIEAGPSDMTQMLFELLAAKLDYLAYAQERAVAEGFLEIARLRRSVEDHARALDYPVDPGLSATTMIRFQIDYQALAQAASKLAPDGSKQAADLIATLSDGKALDLPAGNVIGNTNPNEASILFATEEVLSYLPELEAVSLAETCPLGATSARLRGRLDRLERDRWLVLSRGRAFPGHVVRVTSVQLETDASLISWDPRRPTRHAYPAEPDAEGEKALVFGNVIPARHGLPIRAMTDKEQADSLLAPWQSLLEQTVDGSRVREIELPLPRLSIHSIGYPFPGEIRQGVPMLRVLVEEDSWTRVDDLSLYGPSDEVFVLRPGSQDHAVLRFGDGVNGSALPKRPFKLRMDLSIGLGSAGNVGAYTLNRLLRFGPKAPNVQDPEDMIMQQAGPERDDLVRAIWQVTNPLPGIEGRDPEPMERIRYRAPQQLRDILSAVTPRDYEQLLLRLPYVSGARARVIEAGIRHLIRVTVLLKDEDTLQEAELLRRWALIRQKLEDIRMLGFDVEAVPPTWVPLNIDMVVDADATTDPGRLRENIEESLAGNGGLLDPDSVGLGGDVHLSDIYQTVQRLRGVRAVQVTRFRRLEPQALEHLEDGIVPIGSHEVATLGGPRNPSAGLLTVSVCGGLQ